MKTEARKAVRHGFVLTEQELRRLLDVATQHLNRVAPGGHPSPHFDVRFRNGAITETESIDEVLALENFGSKSLTRLSIHLGDRADHPAYEVDMDFANPDEEEGGNISIRYVVKGEDRDWVFITSSELDERIGKLKRFSPNQLTTKKGFSVLFVPLFALLLLSTSLLSTPFFMSKPKTADDLESAWKSGKIKDPIEALIVVERGRARRDPLDNPMKFFGVVLGVPFVIFGFFVGSVFLFVYLLPPYVFCWGDAVRIHERRRSIARFILVVVITGVVVSAVGGIVANKYFSKP